MKSKTVVGFLPAFDHALEKSAPMAQFPPK